MAEHNIRGAKAEQAVARYLEDEGYEIVDINWKTKWCEIDIVAKKEDVVYFVEVKYRKNAEYGGGFDYITLPKLRQMNLAARGWVEMNNWEGEHQLSAAEVSGDNFTVNFLRQI